MGILFDAASSSSGSETYGPTTTFAHTVGAGGNRIIGVGTVCKYTVGYYVSGITYGGSALTQLTRILWNTTHYVELWYLVAPAIGNASVVVTYTGNTYDACVSLSFTGVNAAAPFGTLTSGTGNTATPTAPTVTSNSGEVVIDICGVSQNVVSTFTPGALQTLGAKIFETNSQFWAGMSYEPGQASVNMTWNHQFIKQWAIIAVPLKSAPAGSQIIWIMFNRAKKFYEDLRRGLIPPQDLLRRRREVFI